MLEYNVNAPKWLKMAEYDKCPKMAEDQEKYINNTNKHLNSFYNCPNIA